jgi:hypothetical protein
MRFFESILVPVLESEIPTLLVTRSVLFETLLSHQIQLRWGGQFHIARRLLSLFLSDPIRLSFIGCAAVLCAMCVERRHTAYDKRRNGHHHKEPHRFEFSGHIFA